ncbi:MFS transporter [Roseovarius aestuariivivens]|uniref:MFS transporter n=1 Tax=Roseovarius aestuariivivens TaxID=1888910 RepID=UPI0010800923|nr:MFS transporter [Roseovarius aestuariivivens]
MLSPFWKLSVAGFAATAITYGPARMGFGLFLSEFRGTFEMSTRAAGQFSSLGFFGMLVGLFAAYWLTARRGPRLPVALGLVSATLGLALVSRAETLWMLYIGVFFSMSSAGFAWTPFNNAVNQLIHDEDRPTALSLISTGTSVGIATAGLVALMADTTGFSWRAGWVVFAGLGALALVIAAPSLRDVAGRPGPGSKSPWSALARPSALPLYGVALSFGLTTAVFLSFAADRIEQAGGLAGMPGGTTPALVFMTFGLVGLSGLATSHLKARLGLVNLIRALMLASALSMTLVAVAPTAWGAVILAAGLQGTFVMMMSAILAFWSDRLFPDLPSLSFTVALMAVGVGSVLGPILAGEVSTQLGGEIMFLCAAYVSAMTAAALSPDRVQERPSRTVAA